MNLRAAPVMVVTKSSACDVLLMVFFFHIYEKFYFGKIHENS